MTAFCGLGKWRGTAEVYGGDGRFLGHGADQRHVRTPEGESRLRIDLSFVGPFTLTGHYVITDKGTHRVYEGPANVGLAEAVAENLVDADHYWPALGLAQRFFLMVLPGGERQLSLALLSRGERLVYAVVGENERVVVCEVGEGEASAPPVVRNVASIDRVNDATGGHGAVLLHRPGVWRGVLSSTDAALEPVGTAAFEETVEPHEGGLEMRTTGGRIAPEPARAKLRTDGFLAWSHAGTMAGSYSLFGGRALSGAFQRPGDELRIERREVVSYDGAEKAVVHTWYRGGARVGVEHGVLRFEPRVG